MGIREKLREVKERVKSSHEVAQEKKRERDIVAADMAERHAERAEAEHAVRLRTRTAKQRIGVAKKDVGIRGVGGVAKRVAVGAGRGAVRTVKAASKVKRSNFSTLSRGGGGGFGGGSPFGSGGGGLFGDASARAAPKYAPVRRRKGKRSKKRRSVRRRVVRQGRSGGSSNMFGDSVF